MRPCTGQGDYTASCDCDGINHHTDRDEWSSRIAELEAERDKYKADRDRISESADECHRLFTKVAKERDKYKEALEEIASMPDNRSTHWEDCPHNTCIAARALREP
jgi:uncharacterized coiled-coil DUF342 family protein